MLGGGEVCVVVHRGHGNRGLHLCYPLVSRLIEKSRDALVMILVPLLIAADEVRRHSQDVWPANDFAESLPLSLRCWDGHKPFPIAALRLVDHFPDLCHWLPAVVPLFSCVKRCREAEVREADRGAQETCVHLLALASPLPRDDRHQNRLAEVGCPDLVAEGPAHPM